MPTEHERLRRAVEKAWGDIEKAQASLRKAVSSLVAIDEERLGIIDVLAREGETTEAALRWIVNVCSGIGKSGEEPTHEEYVAALEAGKAALVAKED